MGDSEQCYIPYRQTSLLSLIGLSNYKLVHVRNSFRDSTWYGLKVERLYCTVKSISKMSTAMKKEYSKAKKVVHPNSRKSIAIAKRAKKISNREKTKMGTLMKQTLVGDKMLWIQEHMEPDVCPYTPELTARLLETYVARNDEEMEQIAIKHSIGGKRNRQHASREDVIRMTKEREQEEYNTCGIEIPDILNSSQCEMLRQWNGELRFIQNFKFRRFGRKHLNEALQKAGKTLKEPSSEAQPKLGTKVSESTFSMENKSDKCTMEVE